MSGLKGTIGSPKGDPVIGWIYDHVESMNERERKALFKLVQTMIDARVNIVSLKDTRFKHRTALLFRREHLNNIDGSSYPENLKSRLRNLAHRYFRQSVEVGQNAKNCSWCGEPILSDDAFNMSSGGKMHDGCSVEYHNEKNDDI